MPPAKDMNVKNCYSRSNFTNNCLSMSARVYQPATNLLPPSPPTSPTGVGPNFLSQSKSVSSMSRQNSQNGGKYS